MASSTVVWLRQDLRIIDHPALSAAAKRGYVFPIYIWNPDAEGLWQPGGASRCWLHGSLSVLKEQFEALGISLTIRLGPAEHILMEFLRETQSDALFWSRRYEPAHIAEDQQIKETFRNKGVLVKSFSARLLHEPWTIQNKQGKPYQVFTAFWKTCMNYPEPEAPLPTIQAAQNHLKPDTLGVSDLNLLPKVHCDTEIRSTWSPGTEQGLMQFRKFLNGPVLQYHTQRDFPCVEGVSRMSPYLHFGEISPRMIWHEVRQKYTGKSDRAACALYLRQLIWREFAYHLLYHFPHTPTDPLKDEFSKFPWKSNSEHLRAWQRGLTGYPLIDAGMRQLWRTGWMHNRVRMIVGSFLVKDLLISWWEGARWFWDTLVDADLANNTLGWQWIGGCGADAAPYFRIFHPVTQSRKFDSEGHYIRQWVPELAQIPSKWIHAPWEAPEQVLSSAGVSLGQNYPKPIIDHTRARLDALNAFTFVRKN